MKRYFVILALILICQAGNSQTMNQLFNEFSKIEQINHVKIGNITMKQPVHRNNGRKRYRSPRVRQL